MKAIATIFAAVLMLGSLRVAQAQKKLPVQWTFEPQAASVAPGGKFTGKLTAKIDPTWHMYSVTTPKGGGLPTNIKIDDAAVAGLKIYQPKPEKSAPTITAYTGSRAEQDISGSTAIFPIKCL